MVVLSFRALIQLGREERYGKERLQFLLKFIKQLNL